MIKIIKLITIYVLALLYISVGFKHFTDTNFFMAIMPQYLPFHRELIYISGFFEILFGLMLIFKKYRFYAGWGLVILLVLIFPANIYLAQNIDSQELLGISQEDAIIRMPFQLPLILLAYWHTKDNFSFFVNLFFIVLFIPTIIYFIFVI